jgi:hypothetical protein
MMGVVWMRWWEHNSAEEYADGMLFTYIVLSIFGGIE